MIRAHVIRSGKCYRFTGYRFIGDIHNTGEMDVVLRPDRTGSSNKTLVEVVNIYIYNSRTVIKSITMTAPRTKTFIVGSGGYY